jgi:NAD-reducing hydrogenase small subunit
MDKVRVATVWLGGCSGCHMSFLDLDERLIDLAPAIDLVYSPLVDAKTFPNDVDITLVEGAVANVDHLRLIQTIRARTKTLISFGDCAVTGNVTALRNALGRAEPVLQRAYADGAVITDAAERRGGGMPPDRDIVPALLDRVLPVHHVVPVDVYLPGCPPSANLIFSVLQDLLGGRKPDLAGRLKYG